MDWMRHRRFPILICVLWIVVGSGAYGGEGGTWRSPMQGLYVGIKFPLVMLATTLVAALICGMLAQLLGLRESFRNCVLMVLQSYAVLSVLVGALAPVGLFFLFNAPPVEEARGTAAYNVILLVHTLIIGVAGILANVCLARLLRYLAPSRGTATAVLVVWLLVHFFVGSQIAWLARPYIGNPWLPVEFLRPDAFESSFFEAVWNNLQQLFSSQ